jgi:hypothetical protein
MDTASPAASIEAITVTAAKPVAAKSHLWDGESFGFTDVLAAINPLQHLPIIGSIYRAITGDTIGNAARVVGDTLYGGAIGLISGLVNVALVEDTGKDLGQHVIAMIEGDDTPAPTKLAEAPAAAPPSNRIDLSSVPTEPEHLPSFGSAATASKLAAAAPPSPLLVPKLVAQATAAAPPPGPLNMKPLPGPNRGIAIDVTPQGIATMRATSAVHNPAPVALNLPAGAFSGKQAQAPAQPDFSDRMREGLAKYDQMMAARARESGNAGVDQIH